MDNCILEFPYSFENNFKPICPLLHLMKCQANPCSHYVYKKQLHHSSDKKRHLKKVSQIEDKVLRHSLF